MAEFKEVIKQFYRMCNSNRSSCKHCPIDPSLKSVYNCAWWITDNCENAEPLIMAWAEEHPMKTNRDKFKETFGFDPYSRISLSRLWFEDEYKEPEKDE